ncbi:MAG: replicative DNA helicase [Ruminococcus sp.]|nr:replicative DNA helicase [Ruminococcus sp.]MDO4882097.1 replicative DNA helicase [Oscillospiraceae bacterium]
MANTEFTSEFSTLPYSAEAEQAVLGAIILDSSVFDKVLDHVKSSDYFYIGLHKQIFQQMQDMMNFGTSIDVVTLLDRLKKSGAFDEASGKTYIMDLAENCPSISNAEEYAKIIKEKYQLRLLITASRKTIDEASAGEGDTSLLLDSAEQRLFDIRSDSSKTGLERIDSVLFQTFARLDSLNKEADDGLKPVPTGIEDLDRMITGLNRSDLIILAARPGMGKTSFALNIARNVACRSKKTVAFFSLEMPKEQLASRLLSSEAKVGGTKLRTGKLNDEDWNRLIPASDVLRRAPLYLDDTSTITITEMKSRLRRLKEIDLVVIDYLQLMASGRRIDNRVQEISAITRNLKIMAKELNVPIITLSQLSRASEQRTGDHRPQLSDLRDSGSIEQDADIVLFLYREGYYDKAEGDNAAPTADVNSGECIVAKNRHGETNTVKLHWQGEFMSFTGIDNRHNEP